MFEKDKIEAAAREHEKAKASLYRPDGSPIYGDAEHKERMRAIDQENTTRFDALGADIEKSIERAQEEILKLEHSDPTDLLSNEELERANARAAFVREDCEAMPPGDLAKRIRGVLASGDKATAWLYRRYATARHEQDGLMNHYGEVSLSSEEVAAYGELRAALPGLEEALREPAKERRREAAERELAAARELRFYASRRAGEVDGSDARAREEQREAIRATL